jgi:hypothetical protein
MWWIAEVEWRTGLLEPGTKGSFSDSVVQAKAPADYQRKGANNVSVNHDISQDGKVAILTVNRQ